MTTNGHVNGHQETAPPIKAPQAVAIRVFRIEKGTSQRVRMLSPSYGGVFTHYHRGRSQYCTGRDCPSPVHKVDRVWKGYVSAQVWNDASRNWFPVCLEITESLELTFRGVYARGQVWELWREQGPRGKELPVSGKLEEERDEHTTPKPFDIVPCLRALFHIDSIDLSSLNPLPPRVIVDVCNDDGPEALKPKMSDNLGVPYEGSAKEEFDRRAKERAKTAKSPSDHKPAYKR